MPVRKNKTRKAKQSTSKNSTSRQLFEKQVVLIFLQMLNTVKLYHWKTRSYATHKATDKLYENLNDTIDNFVEILLGKYGDRVDLLSVKSIPLCDFRTEEEFIREIVTYKSFLINLDNNGFLKTMSNSDLYNVRDEIVGQLNQLLYLLTFK